MTTKELIQAEIDRMSEQRLEELYRLIKSFAQSKEPDQKPSLMSRLKEVQIEAPEDFAANFDLYLSGEKCAGEDLR